MRAYKIAVAGAGYVGMAMAVLRSVQPGVTGYWQAYARNNATYQSGHRQQMEMTYIRQASIWLDCKILMKTVVAVLRRDGAK